MKISKITQPQLRILRHKLECMAKTEREKARKQYEQRKNELETQSLAICSKILDKHRKALAATLVCDVSTWRGIQVAVTMPCDNPAREAFQKDCAAAIKKAGLDGLTDETMCIYVPSLGLTGEGRNGDCLNVPVAAGDKWQRLADNIDNTFMSGDASQLLNLIESFQLGE
jgi:hypothetical protein